MSGNLNNGFELFPFHLFGKFSRTEAKYIPYVFRHFGRHLEGLAAKFDVIVPTDFNMVVTKLDTPKSDFRERTGTEWLVLGLALG